MALPVPTELLTTRFPRPIVDEARRIAERDGESLATTIRKLVRTGIEIERRDNRGGEAM